MSSAWNGGAWKQQGDGKGKWSQTNWWAPNSSKAGWCTGWHKLGDSSDGWQWTTPTLQPKAPKSPKARSPKRWTGKWEPLASSSAWLPQECSPSEEATLCQKEINALSQRAMFDPIRNALYEQMAQAQAKAAEDKRTPTQRLLAAEKWLAREQKRMSWDRERHAELSSWIEERALLIEKEIEVVASLRAEVGAAESSHGVERTQPDDIMDVCDMTADTQSWLAFKAGVYAARAQEDPVLRMQMEASLVLRYVPHAQPHEEANCAKGYGKGKGDLADTKPAPYAPP